MISTPEENPDATIVQLQQELSQSAFGRRLLAFLEPIASAAPAPVSPANVTVLPETEGAIMAAISHTFGLDVVQSATASPLADRIAPSSKDEAEAILANSVSVMIGGRRRLRLTPEARADLLHRVYSSNRFQELLNRVAAADNEDRKSIAKDQIRLPTAWLRWFLQKTSTNLAQAPAGQLRAAVQALEELQHVRVDDLKLPSLSDARRFLERSELLEPLRVLVGTTGGWDGTPRKDRFVGRQQEIATLRKFVDELKGESLGEGVGRLLNRFYKGALYLFGVQDESVLFVEAQGGLGKSTLMAKFMVDHALNQIAPFPFAYLDFDRASLHPRASRASCCWKPPDR